MEGIVVARAEIEIEDIDGVDLLDDPVVLAYAYLPVDGRGRAEDDALEEVALLRQLNLHDDVLALLGLGLHVHAIALVLETVLTVLTLQNLGDGHRLLDKHLYKSLKHLLVRYVAKDALDGPVEAYIFAFLCHRRLDKAYGACCTLRRQR